MNGQPKVSIFLSSPADVTPEREAAEWVVQRLNGVYAVHVELAAKRWEQHFYEADRGFQEAIAPMEAFDMVVGILWKRIGSVAVDLHDSRLDLAREIGATHTINSRSTDMADELSAITGGEGVNYILDTTGVPAVVSSAAGALSIRGTLAVVGAAAPGTTAAIDIGVPSLVKGWTFKTIVQGSSVPQVFIPTMVELWKQGRFPLDKLVKTYKFDDINTAFNDSYSGATVKPVVIF